MIRISDERISELLTQADGLAPKSGSIFKSLAILVEDEVIARIDADRWNATDAQELIRTAPARIWLQVSEDAEGYDKPFPLNTEDVSWCESHVLDCEVEYVRADLSPTIPEGMVLVHTEILDRFPEINPSNYDHDDACRLNAWGVELVLAAAQGERNDD